MVISLYGGTKEKHANSQAIWSTHIISHEKCKLKSCLKRDKNCPKISFQLKCRYWERKANFLYNYFDNLCMNLILTHILAQVQI
jgi:hypothetical protein